MRQAIHFCGRCPLTAPSKTKGAFFLATIFIVAVVSSFVLNAALGLAHAQQRSLTVVSFGGAYGAAQDKHQVQPFIKESGLPVLFESYAGGVAEIKAQVESGQVHWDVVDIETIDLERACAEGLLEIIPHEILLVGEDGTAALDDFIPEAVENECGIGQMVWSTVFAYNDDTIGAQTPESIADFFDVDNIPGKRGLRKRPQVNLEWALLADGVSPDELYDHLATPEGQAQAWAKLDSIKDHIVWFDSWSQAPQLLNDGGAVLVQSAHGRFYDAIAKENKPFTIVWDGHIYDLDAWGIVAGTPYLDEALDFVAFTTGTTPLAGFEDVAYGPARRSSLALVDPAVRTHMPSAHLDIGLQADSLFWADYGESLGETFNEWLLH